MTKKSHPTPAAPNQAGLSFTLFLAVAVLGAVVMFFLLSDNLDGPNGAARNNRSEPTRGGLAVGSPLPSFREVSWVDGAAPDLAGKVVVVDAWATWCVPCQIEMPKLVKTYEKYAGRNDVVFVGLTSEPESQLPAIKRFLQKTGVAWPNGYDANQAMIDLEANYIPTTWVVGRDGKIAWNLDSSGSLEQAIERELKK